MKPSKIGQIAKFHTPLADENPDQLYVILEINSNETGRTDLRERSGKTSYGPRGSSDASRDPEGAAPCENSDPPDRDLKLRISRVG